MESAGTGFLLLVVAGVMNASFALPMKFTRRWAWENTWVVWTGLALLLMPIIAAAITVPQLPHVYAQAGTRSVVLVAACGMGWGIAQVLFGLAVDSIHADKALTPAGLGLIGGVLLVMVGVGICARAGTLREQTAKQAQMNRSPTSGILMAVMSGIGAASMNFGVAFGGPVVEAAAVHGADPAWRMNAVWLPLMTAGAVPNLLYCGYLMRSKRTSANFSANGTAHYWLFASVMAIFWFVSTLMYGVASLKLGALGPVYGWPLFMSLIVIVSTVIGILAGEWKNALKSAVGLQLAGVGVLITAVIVLSYAGRHL